MIIAVYGAGYVGLVSSVCLAKLGHDVVCADINESRVNMLAQGQCPIYEEQLPELLKEQLAHGRLAFTVDLSTAIMHAQVHIIATGTPSLADGNADLSQVFSVSSRIAQEAQEDCILVIKSTVPVGTGDEIQNHINEQLARCNRTIKIEVVSNPEFLREGTAVQDFLCADRVILGGKEQPLSVLKQMYLPLAEQGVSILCMSRRSAELTKYSANAMLACRISFINQISRLADELGANIDDIRQGIGLDYRIGPHFLNAGIGYGGSCFPKDVRALIQTAKRVDVDTNLLDAIESINSLQKNWIFDRLAKHFKQDLKGLTIGFWGLSFKPGTDDLREASSLVAIEALLQAGAKLRVFDPVAMPAAQRLLGDSFAIIWCESAEAVFAKNLDALVIATEWPQFKNYPLDLLKVKLGDAPLFDGRNCYQLSAVKNAKLAGYYSVGRPPIVSVSTETCIAS
ncbi:UDP-glucose dehydrogenase family protein [Legionella micdadei]|uniref:UDP-glucose 6-dehydrogenase n=2 Tax=Legionella micdadei TaxID=451 RepID=A0A098GEQ1_LEGMI|nr:UDP-glucose/GDP-mannose dehydrogenase family protein [Legionella micdadei]ARG98903.1 nucleotide sugar dehydrogenase [Legionella micdadei]KTD28625.1 UDP-glucose 6-dehydrogenase [Legionella micdadei]CEG60482.1 UDP-glucose 6-dehydrogenase [Legionella micdadei]SCX79684.1 UDPglucose 6-dehydrogenase [Legionella micdadei]